LLREQPFFGVFARSREPERPGKRHVQLRSNTSCLGWSSLKSAETAFDDLDAVKADLYQLHICWRPDPVVVPLDPNDPEVAFSL
jgi:hypothetical protein